MGPESLRVEQAPLKVSETGLPTRLLAAKMQKRDGGLRVTWLAVDRLPQKSFRALASHLLEITMPTLSVSFFFLR